MMSHLGNGLSRVSRKHKTLRPSMEGLELRSLLTTGTITTFPLDPLIAPSGLTKSADGSFWLSGSLYTDVNYMFSSGKIAKIGPGGTLTVLPDFSDGGTMTSIPMTDTQGNRWFSEEFYPPVTGYAQLVYTDKPAIGKIAPDGTYTSFALPNDLSAVLDPVFGPDGNLWFSGIGQNLGMKSFVSMTPDGVVQEYPLPSREYETFVVAPDGSAWLPGINVERVSLSKAGSIVVTTTTVSDASSFTSMPVFDGSGNLWELDTSYDTHLSKIDRISPNGILTRFPLPASFDSNNNSMGIGSDGNLWVSTGSVGAQILRVTPEGVVTEYPVPNQSTSSSGPLVLGSDNNLWFTEGTNIDSISPKGTITVYPTSFTTPLGNLTTGPDGNLWFTTFNLGNTTLDRFEIDPPPKPTLNPNTGTQPTGGVSASSSPILVQGVTRSGLGFQPTTLTITFSAAVDPSTATDTANYTIMLVGPAGHSRPDARPVPIQSASYNATTHTVTLTPKHRLPLASYYKLTVAGASPKGIHGEIGSFLAGAGKNRPGTNCETILHRFAPVNVKSVRNKTNPHTQIRLRRNAPHVTSA